MGDEILILPARPGSIKLVVASGWCQVVLVLAHGERSLGAESEGYVIDHLIAGLRACDVRVPRAPQWLLSLAEQHASLYSFSLTAGIGLMVQDSEARTVFLTELDEYTRERWLFRLGAWATRKRPLELSDADAPELRVHPPFMVHQLLRCAPTVLAFPTSVFRGLRRSGELRDGIAYCGHVAVRYDNDGAEVGAPEGKLFCVYVNAQGYVFDWDWVAQDPDRPDRPTQWNLRFNEQLEHWPGTALQKIAPVRGHEFDRGRPWYSAVGDCVFCYFSDDPSYAERSTEYLTVFKAFANDEPVGFKVKNVRHLLHIIRAHGGAVQLVGATVAVSVLVLLEVLSSDLVIQQEGGGRNTWTLIREKFELRGRDLKVEITDTTMDVTVGV